MYNNKIIFFNINSKISPSARNGCGDNVCTLLASDSRHHGYESLASLYQHTTLYHYSGIKMMNRKSFINQIILFLSFKYYENNSCSNSIINFVHQIISHILAYSNSCVNPILYAFLSEPFRRGFWAIITCIRPSGPHGMQHNGYEMAEMKKKKEGKIIICS